MLRIYITLFTLLMPILSLGGDLLPAPRQVSDHTWAWIGPYGPPTRENGGFRMNLGFVVGDDAVAVIDSGYGGAMAEAMLAHIRRITDRPVRYVINTNSQPHRIMGNPVFRRAEAEVIAAAEAVPRIKAEAQVFAATIEGVLGLTPNSVEVPSTPTVAIDKETSLDLGGVRLRVIPVGDAHTPGSLVVAVNPDALAFAGDVLYRGRLLSILSKSNVREWIKSFQRLRQLGDVLFIPGHGEPGPLSAFEHSTHDYLTALKRHMDQAVEEDIDLQDAISSFDQSAWKGFADFEALAGRNAHQAYLQSEAAAFE
ncbi:beta-lactamase [Candidatus Endoriftia persephone str. Guaymas]|jgi:glyoxylase-like metal-dependent hydrolase (beta-lactamase superfamily II)|uniref:Metallo beta-lactamase superfamily, SoxH-like protein n=2 Tax=Gammaproteobacteria TaxID=1236 RepID=G2FDC9_9GAMM|nr:MBL fold metallo-hydrolase [Candidatus Endoriftia persephone]EGW55215.1 metallo beta-lactamase superfamily, SoxH-like protein [endosymbiont of Tevnia jerichonana (vent Tica)]MBA1333030.1 beta-lactamase [Candidatus Endoriftia persephone str. Guaymas]USF88697.1 MBL fold metallo-hydrolase [Candidatus Endoriftia persephone]